MSSCIPLAQIKIHALYWQSISSFQRLLEFFTKTDNVPASLPDDFGRLKVWAENVGAHRRGSNASLDHRLREATSVRDSVKGLLVNLNDVLEESRCIMILLLHLSLGDSVVKSYQRSEWRRMIQAPAKAERTTPRTQ
jgi:hypothetical protein